MLGTWGPCPEAPPSHPMPPHRLAQPSPQSFLKSPGHSRSEDGRLLAHPSVQHRTCIQTGVPAQGGSQSKGDTTHTHGTQTQRAGQGTQMVGETRAGAYGACSSVVLLVVFVGEGEESRTRPERAFQKAAESGRDLQEKEHQRPLAPGTGRDGESLQAWMKRDPTK